MDIDIYRTEKSDQGTFGILAAGFFFCRTLELPYRDNQRGISCIPAGRYDYSFENPVSPMGGFQTLLYIHNVLGRDGIFVHAGNFAGDEALGFKSDSDGCPLLGRKTGIYRGQRIVSHSRPTLREFHRVTMGQPGVLRIRECF
jgi:Family of unknown function (DUF5675)